MNAALLIAPLVVVAGVAVLGFAFAGLLGLGIALFVGGVLLGVMT